MKNSVAQIAAFLFRALGDAVAVLRRPATFVALIGLYAVLATLAFYE